MNKKILLLFGILVLLPFIYSEASFIFEKNQSVDLKISCYDTNNSLCTSGTTCHLTCQNPSDENILKNKTMTHNGNFYNYTLGVNDTEDIGEYSCSVSCYGTNTGISTFSYEVNALGLESTDARVGAANRGTFVLFIMAVIFFMIFIFMPKEKMEQNEMGQLVVSGNNRPIKWTFFLLGILFLTIGINVTFISIYNDIGDTQIGAIFDKLGAVSYYLFWISFGLLLFLWIYTTIATLGDRKRMKQARDVGTPTDLGKY